MRFFRKRQKDALYVAAGGICISCRTRLKPGWHADHAIPWAAGGETTTSNGQALCPTCNYKKGKSMHVACDRALDPWPETIELRPWQANAVEQYHAQSSHDFLIVATPGAGKTKTALRVAHDLLADRTVSRVVVVTPSLHLKRQWQDAAAEVGIALAIDISGAREPADHHGCCITYHQVFTEAHVQRANAVDPTLVIFDEVHHAGDGNGWGQQVFTAFELATRRLALSGTPFRSDNRKIPFVRYDNDRSAADFSYGYGDACADDIVREVFFPQYEGQLSWYSSTRSKIVEATFASKLKDDKEESDRLRAALVTEWLEKVIKDADEKLQEIRDTGHPRAGGLITCMDQGHANEVATRVRHITNTEPDVIVSDDPTAHATLAKIASGERLCRWIVSVAMVSEGVDIPGLRVGIYATNKTTELFFRQFVGRMVRRIRELENDSDAYVYLPSDARIVEFAKRIKEERDHVLEQKTTKRREVIEGLTRQLSMFSAFSGTAIANGVISDGEVLAESELVEASSLREAVSKIAGIPFSREVVARMARLFRSAGAGVTPQRPEKIALAKLREEYRKECNRLQRSACIRHGYEFSKTNRWLNEQTGVSSIEVATVDQLKRRLELINEVLLSGKWT